MENTQKLRHTRTRSSMKCWIFYVCLTVLWLHANTAKAQEEEHCFAPCVPLFADSARKATSDQEMCSSTRSYVDCMMALCDWTTLPDAAYNYPRAVFNVTGYYCDVPFEDTVPTQAPGLAGKCPGYEDCLREFIGSGLEQTATDSTGMVPNTTVTCILVDSLSNCLSTHCGVSRDWPPLQNLVNGFEQKLAEKGFPCVRPSTTTATTPRFVGSTTPYIRRGWDSRGICDAYRKCSWYYPMSHETCRFPEEYFDCVKRVCQSDEVVIPKEFLEQQQEKMASWGKECEFVSDDNNGGKGLRQTNSIFLIIFATSLCIFSKLTTL